MALTREAILAANDLARVPVNVPDWGGEVFVGVMTGTDRDAFEGGSRTAEGKVDLKTNVRARLLVKCLVDETGKRLFADGDAAELGLHSSVILDQLWDKAIAINKLSKKEVAELEKNSDAGQTGDSTSDSPSPSV